MCLIDMQFQNLFHFSRTDLYSLAGRLFFSPANTFATLLKNRERCSTLLLRGCREFRAAAGITQQLDWRIDLSFLPHITINE